MNTPKQWTDLLTNPAVDAPEYKPDPHYTPETPATDDNWIELVGHDFEHIVHSIQQDAINNPPVRQEVTS